MTGLVEKVNCKGTVYYVNSGDEITAKMCSKCEVIKMVDRFTKKKNNFGGLSSCCKECKRKYRQENKESIRKYLQENKERIAERARKYRQENKESIAEYKIKYRQENKESIRKYLQENKENLTESRRKYQQENKELFQIKCARRRACKRQLPDDLTLEQRNVRTLR